MSMADLAAVLKSRYQNMLFASQAIILDKIVDDVPSARISHEVFQSFAHFQLAEKSFHSPGKIEYLIAVDLYTQILAAKHHAFRKGIPSAVETAFGRTILGPIDKHVNNLGNATSLLTSVVSLDGLV